MKKIYMYALSAMLLGGLVSSCELKEELWGEKNEAETGKLDLDVSVKDNAGSRAGEGTAAADFPVTITSTTDAEAVYEYAAYKNMTDPVTLPVGTYTIESHSKLELVKQMSEPYYEGSTNFTISKGITSQVDVVCKMKNTRIRINYGEEFLAKFQSWEITLNDGKDGILTFSSENGKESPVVTYWLLSEGVETLRMDITAVTTDGTKIVDSKSFTKADAEENYDDDTVNFTGGETVSINLGVKEPDVPEPDKSTVSITVNVDLTFADKDATVEIPVEDVTDPTPNPNPDPEPTPNPGDGETTDAIKLNIPADITYSVNSANESTDAPASADVLIEAEKGLKSLTVKIKPGNQGFQEIIGQLKLGGKSFLDGVEMVDNADVNTMFSELGMEGVTAPASGATSYTFPVGAFFTFLNLTGPTDAGKAHEFHIEAIDAEGNTKSGVLKIYINSAE
ncbi:DUF4493 domain-containing protein [uncultured Bacteroides sp.]|uniref:DUF4493 domain-containing protein n=1 Tax=uncultured Bacteroides sp. TaxID=162156 RepID=UPI002630F08A|nr:DUF4493 domain-containing protein [uncultured Bacteroides sp.]